MERDAQGFERAFRIAFERSASPMALVSSDRRFLDVNPALTGMLGWTREAMLERGVQDFMRPELRAQDTATFMAFLAAGSATDLMELRTARRTFLRFLVHREADVLDGRHLAVMLLDPGPDELTDPDDPLVRDADDATLSPREAEVLTLVALGRSNEEIGDALFISPETVRTHVRNAMVRRGARNRAHLIAIAMRDGVIVVD